MELSALDFCAFFVFNATAPAKIYTLSLHDALPISSWPCSASLTEKPCTTQKRSHEGRRRRSRQRRSEEHTSELQSRLHLVCRLLLEKKKSLKKSWTRRRTRPLEKRIHPKAHRPISS